MKNPDEVIEKVLAGLRNSDAPLGMEHRILEAMQDHTSAQSSSGWRRLIPIWLIAQAPPVITRSVAGGIALAVIFALGLAIPIPMLHRHEHAPAQSKRSSAPLATLPPAPSKVVAESAQPPAPEASVRSKKEINTRRAELASADNSDDSIAMREMRAPSHPAPPLPLTEQEKLLLRMAQARGHEELATLTPVKWAAQDAEKKAEFDKFFGQSPTGDKE